jgi:UDP-N-acetylglucosamine 2-epimerase
MTTHASTIVSVVGARPQFIKLGPVSRGLRDLGLREFVVHTGQHYDVAMSQRFFEELALPEPDINLGITEPGPINQLGAMVTAVGRLIGERKPALLIVFGDTTSTIAASLAAAYAAIPVAHVEAGMRSFDPAMPEEIARTVTDRLARLWFTASRAAETNLQREGLGPTDFVGDVMYDVVEEAAPRLAAGGDRLAAFGVAPGEYVLATVHRAKNTDERDRLERIMDGLAQLPLPVVFPVHPRTRAALERYGLSDRLTAGRIHAVEPIRYIDTLALAQHARRVFTDSGGLQKEAYYLGTPCTTLREETEWVETVELGWNVLVGADDRRLVETLALEPPPPTDARPYGDGRAGVAIAQRIGAWLQERHG